MGKLRQFLVNVAPWMILLAGALEALLLARFVVRLLAGRPDNPSFALLLWATEPLVRPLAALDYDQPPFGAALEFSTLSMATIVPLLIYLAWIVLQRSATLEAATSS